MALLSIFIAVLFLYSLVSGRLERTSLTAPIVFTLAGMLALLFLPELRDREGSPAVFLRLAEIGLVMLLFTDASRVDLRLLKDTRSLPARLLSTGMLLTLLLGALGALLIFPQLTIWEAGILAAILAPTDAGLGQAIVNSPRVPLPIRQALNVEAGLNDGLSVPFLLFFMGLAGAGAGGDSPRLARFIVEQLGGGVLIGIVFGYLGGWLLDLAQRKSWMAEPFQQLGLVAIPLFCIIASEAFGASMFIAAFVAGLAAQVSFKEAGRHASEFTEQWGQILNYSVFFLFGIMFMREWQDLKMLYILYAIVSLTIVRMLPVAVSLIGAGQNKPTILFMGWFGPRGLASIVLGLVYLESVAHQAAEPTIRLAVMATVFLSIFLHGFSTKPGIAIYARRVGGNDAESGRVDEL